MAGSIFGNMFSITTWGESHGLAVGVVVDGCPAGISICEEDIQIEMDRRKPGSSEFVTPRREEDKISILSGVFLGKTTGAPISMLVFNKDSRSKDYDEIKDIFRPSHADFTFTEKYGFRDYRGGGRSSGRETLARVAGGAVAKLILRRLGVQVSAYTKSIGGISIDAEEFDKNEVNELCMPDHSAYLKAKDVIKGAIDQKNSCGGVVECVVSGMPTGIGEPVFRKLDAVLAQAMLSIGAVKGFEVGSGFLAATKFGSENNDSYFVDESGKMMKKSNNAGGIVGGISDGADIVFRVGVKPTSSIGQRQSSVSTSFSNIETEIGGRHDPVIVPRAVVVVECMAAICLVDLLMENMVSKIDSLERFYSRLS